MIENDGALAIFRQKIAQRAEQALKESGLTKRLFSKEYFEKWGLTNEETAYCYVDNLVRKGDISPNKGLTATRLNKIYRFFLLLGIPEDDPTVKEIKEISQNVLLEKIPHSFPYVPNNSLQQPDIEEGRQYSNGFYGVLEKIGTKYIKWAKNQFPKASSRVSCVEMLANFISRETDRYEEASPREKGIITCDLENVLNSMGNSSADKKH